MAFITPRDTSGWDAKQIADQETLVALADMAICWLTEWPPETQEQILDLLKSAPSDAMDWEDITKLALGADDYAVNHDETNEEVLSAAWEIVTRPEILARLDGNAILAYVTDTGTDYGLATIGVNLLAELAIEQIPVTALVDFAVENAGDDSYFDDAVFALLEKHKLYDAMRRCFVATGDESMDTELAALCREAIAVLEESTNA